MDLCTIIIPAVNEHWSLIGLDDGFGFKPWTFEQAHQARCTRLFNSFNIYSQSIPISMSRGLEKSSADPTTAGSTAVQQGGELPLPKNLLDCCHTATLDFLHRSWIGPKWAEFSIYTLCFTNSWSEAPSPAYSTLPRQKILRGIFGYCVLTPAWFSPTLRLVSASATIGASNLAEMLLIPAMGISMLVSHESWLIVQKTVTQFDLIISCCGVPSQFLRLSRRPAIPAASRWISCNSSARFFMPGAWKVLDGGHSRFQV